MNSWWKWVLGVMILGAIVTGVYFYSIAPKKNEDASIINIYRDLGADTPNQPQTLDQSISILSGQTNFAVSNASNPVFDEISRDLSSYKE